MAASAAKGRATRRKRELVQDRAHATFEALVEAASAQFWSKGYDATQAPEIAAAAGVSVGTFYRYFDSKADVLREIGRRELTRAHLEVLALLSPERFAGKGRRGAVTAAIDALINTVKRHPERHRLFYEMARRDEELAAIKRPFDDEMRRRMTEIITLACSREQVADPAATAYVLHTALFECAMQLAGVHGRPPLAPSRARAALSELVHHALFGSED